MHRIVGFSALILIVGCGGKAESPPPARSNAEQRAVDSTIGASGLPGAQGVRGALAASDSAARRARELDSISKVR